MVSISRRKTFELQVEMKTPERNLMDSEKPLSQHEAKHQSVKDNELAFAWTQDRTCTVLFPTSTCEWLAPNISGAVLDTPMLDFITLKSKNLIRDLFHKRALIEQYNPSAEAETIELSLNCINGDMMRIEIVAVSKRDLAGMIVGYHGFIRDITSRREREEDLRISAIAFQSCVGMCITDGDKKILRVNEAFTEITGYRVEEVTGMKPGVLKSDRHNQSFYASLWATIERDGAWRGETWIRHKSGLVFPQNMTVTAVNTFNGVTSHYVATFTNVSQLKTVDENTDHLAFHDSLTGLPNRRHLMKRLKQAAASSARYGRKGALLFVDLDNFKTLNDTRGHFEGDQLLKQVGERLAACVRESDIVARQGGDEFVVMLVDLSENVLDATLQAEVVGEKIVSALREMYLLEGSQYHCSASIGATLFGEDSEDAEQIIRRADLAMYQAKATGRNRLIFFDSQMQTAASMRSTKEARLRDAMTNNRFTLHYQVQINAQATGEPKLIGAEAFLRWNDSDLGITMPSEFIQVAEETGMIISMGTWVLAAACTQLAVWASQPKFSKLTISINISARQFLQSDFADQIVTTLQQTGANPCLLCLEFSGSTLISHEDDIISKMKTLKSLGIRFALDDFGTGYSSLSALSRLPLDQLKIDHELIKNLLKTPEDASIALMIIGLAKTLNVEVIAEGVETAEQRDFLCSHGCSAYQGYLTSRPLPIREFEVLASRRTT